MPKRPLSAGDNIESRCTRCRTVTNHIIVALVGERVVRVQCNTCDGIHNYHAPTAAVRGERQSEPKVAQSGKRPRTARAPAHREAWLAAGGDTDPAQATEYRMTGSYRLEERVRHPMFGVGVVTSVKAGKMEVLFETGPKLLRCG